MLLVTQPSQVGSPPKITGDVNLITTRPLLPEPREYDRNISEEMIPARCTSNCPFHEELALLKIILSMNEKKYWCLFFPLLPLYPILTLETMFHCGNENRF